MSGIRCISNLLNSDILLVLQTSNTQLLNCSFLHICPASGLLVSGLDYYYVLIWISLLISFPSGTALFPGDKCASKSVSRALHIPSPGLHWHSQRGSLTKKVTSKNLIPASSPWEAYFFSINLNQLPISGKIWKRSEIVSRVGWELIEMAVSLYP